jgi:hyperosmotically inducible periplasmic protein
MNSLKSSVAAAALAALCVSGAGLVALQSGCASTPTSESTGEYVDDAAITTKVKAAFIKDDYIKSFDISVETYKGVVQLSGFVNNAEQKQRAAEVARGVAGVRDVKNSLTIK